MPRSVGAEHRRVHSPQQFSKPPLVRRGQHHDAGALVRRETAVVEIVVIERDERAAELAGETIVMNVGGAAKVVVFQHEEHVPARTSRMNETTPLGMLASA